jgi:hypothetical protein
VAWSRAELMRFLEQNADKQFVRRILHPDLYPSLPAPDGKRQTHMMEWGEADGKYFVYPRIGFESGALKDWGEKAFDRAIMRGDYVEFDNPEEAEWFSQNYKSIWRKK